MSKPGISFLSESEIEAIHEASLRVLERTGHQGDEQASSGYLKEGWSEGGLRDWPCLHPAECS